MKANVTRNSKMTGLNNLSKSRKLSLISKEDACSKMDIPKDRLEELESLGLQLFRKGINSKPYYKAAELLQMQYSIKLMELDPRIFKVQNNANIAEVNQKRKLKFQGSLKDICNVFAQLRKDSKKAYRFDNSPFEIAKFIVDNFAFTEQEELSEVEIANAIAGKDFSKDISLIGSLELLSTPFRKLLWVGYINQLYYILKKLHITPSERKKLTMRKGIICTYNEIAAVVINNIEFRKGSPSSETIVQKLKQKHFSKLRRPDIVFP